MKILSAARSNVTVYGRSDLKDRSRGRFKGHIDDMQSMIDRSVLRFSKCIQLIRTDVSMRAYSEFLYNVLPSSILSHWSHCISLISLYQRGLIRDSLVCLQSAACLRY